MTFLITLLAILLPSTLVFADSNDYRLGPGDVVSIQVFGEQDLSMETRIGEKGMISYPFLGELGVLDKSPLALEKQILRGLKGPYLVDPKVNVTVVEYRKFYVNGEVESPGGYEFQPGLTVRKAISIAGGATERASSEKIYVIRENDRSQTPKQVGMGSTLRPGDILTVEESFF